MAKEVVESVQLREIGGGECTVARKRRWRVYCTVYSIAKEEVESVQHREKGSGECAVSRKRRRRMCSSTKEAVESVK
jgi:DNA gyrase inhibitor GyrI